MCGFVYASTHVWKGSKSAEVQGLHHRRCLPGRERAQDGARRQGGGPNELTLQFRAKVDRWTQPGRNPAMGFNDSFHQGRLRGLEHTHLRAALGGGDPCYLSVEAFDSEG